MHQSIPLRAELQTFFLGKLPCQADRVALNARVVSKVRQRKRALRPKSYMSLHGVEYDSLTSYTICVNITTSQENNICKARI